MSLHSARVERPCSEPSESPTLSTNSEGMSLQLIASGRVVLTVGDVEISMFASRQGEGWRTFEKFLIEQLGSDQHPMDPCVFILREPRVA